MTRDVVDVHAWHESVYWRDSYWRRLHVLVIDDGRVTRHALGAGLDTPSGWFGCLAQFYSEREQALGVSACSIVAARFSSEVPQ